MIVTNCDKKYKGHIIGKYKCRPKNNVEWYIQASVGQNKCIHGIFHLQNILTIFFFFFFFFWGGGGGGG